MLTAEELGADGGEVLESFAPTSFTVRALDTGPAREGASPSLAWGRSGKTLFVCECAPDETSGVVAWNVESLRARPVALNLPVAGDLLAAGIGDTFLLGFPDPNAGQPTVALVQRGHLQPQLEAEITVDAAALLGEHVLVVQSRLITARTFRGAVRWSMVGTGITLGDTGSFVMRERDRLEFYDPFVNSPRRVISVPDRPMDVHVVRRRALLRDARSLVMVGEDLLERVLDSRAGHVAAVSPSARQAAFLGRRDASPLIVDLRTGQDWAFEVGPPINACRWSPSGRRLAVACGGGQLFLLEGQ